MDINKYYKNISNIVENDGIDKNKKLKLLKLLDSLKKLGGIDPVVAEDNAYTDGDTTLSNYERIIYELNSLNNSLIRRCQPNDILKKYTYYFDKDMDEEIFKKTKMEITDLQLENGIEPKFYSVFGTMIENELLFTEEVSEEDPKGMGNR